jgi:hypothetical protein
MATSLGARLKKEGAGVYYGSVADMCMNPRDQMFGTKNDQMVYAAIPRNHLSFRQLRKQVPEELLHALYDPDNRKNRIRIEGGTVLFFLHYAIDQKKIARTCEQKGVLVDPRIFRNDGAAVSGIYTNLMGEAMFLGNRDLMQEVTTYLKGGFDPAFAFVADLVGKSLARTRALHVQELMVVDLLSEPHNVHLAR